MYHDFTHFVVCFIVCSFFVYFFSGVFSVFVIVTCYVLASGVIKKNYL